MGKLVQEKRTCRTLKYIRQQYLMSQGSPPRMERAGLFPAESSMRGGLTTTHENDYVQRSIPFVRYLDETACGSRKSTSVQPQACCQSVDSVPTCRQRARGTVQRCAPPSFPHRFVSPRFPTRRQVPLALAWRLLCLTAVDANGSKTPASCGQLPGCR